MNLSNRTTERRGKSESADKKANAGFSIFMGVVEKKVNIELASASSCKCPLTNL